MIAADSTNEPPPAGGAGTALCTVLSDSFVPGFAVLAHSLRKHHPGLNLPFVVIHHPELAPLAPSSRELIRSWYPDVRFHEVDASGYQVVWANRDGRLRTPDRLKSAFFILEAFSLKEFDRVVTLDSDMICTGDLSSLFTHDAAFAATRGIDYDKGGLLDYFNTGVLVIGPAHLTGETYRALLEHRISSGYEKRKGKADQAILNDYLGYEGFTPLDESFNITKRKFPDESYEKVEDVLDHSVRILHFVGEKPWQLHRGERELNFTKLEDFWAGQLRLAMSYDQLVSHLRLLQAPPVPSIAALNKERSARIRDGRALCSEADRIISQVLNQIEAKSVSSKQPARWIRWLGLASRALPRRGVLSITAKARRLWARQLTKFEEKISALETKQN
jgi:hypothetical protein